MDTFLYLLGINIIAMISVVALDGICAVIMAFSEWFYSGKN